MKHFFLIDQGDWINHFLEIAEEELRRASSEASINTLQSQLEVAIRASTVQADPFGDDIRCEFKTMSLLDQAVLIGQPDSLKTSRMSGTFANRWSEECSITYILQLWSHWR